MKEQRIVTVFHPLSTLHAFDLDAITKKLYADNWCVKQIVSTSFEQQKLKTAPNTAPAMAITLLLEKS